MAFGELTGHEKQVAILRNAMANNRIAHAYLFYGMEGIGKRTAAAVFARALNCEGESPPCNACASCRKAQHQNHPDIITIPVEGQFIKIGAIKALQEQMKFRPREGRRRVFVLPEAGRMNAAAANALLKTLEEPSAGNILLLTTSRPHALPLTILSRCQHLRFTPLPPEVVDRYLRETESLDREAAAVLAASSGGSIGRALEMKHDDWLKVRNGIIEHLSDDPSDPIKKLAFAGRLGTEREEILESLDILRTCYRDAMVLRETEDAQRLIFQDRSALIRVLAGRLSGRSLLNNLATVEEAMRAIDQNANKTLTLETMAINLA
jgi:DNA polymerase-3 subunit delta'